MDTEGLQLAGGIVTLSYHSRTSVAKITHANAALVQSVKEEAIESSNFSALASDSSTDHTANKRRPVYTRTLRKGGVQTAFHGLHDLRDGTAASILAAYKQTMLHARLPIEKWVACMLWYRTDGAKVM